MYKNNQKSHDQCINIYIYIIYFFFTPRISYISLRVLIYRVNQRQHAKRCTPRALPRKAWHIWDEEKVYFTRSNVLILIYIYFFFLSHITLYSLLLWRCFVGQNKYGTARDCSPGVTQGLTHLGWPSLFFPRSIIYYIIFFLPPRSYYCYFAVFDYRVIKQKQQSSSNPGVVTARLDTFGMRYILLPFSWI